MRETNSGLVCITALILLAPSAGALDLNATLYGELNVSRDLWEGASDNWVSNVSRVGVKGKHAITDALSAIYQVEQEVDVVHGGTDVDNLFSTRNTFIGLEGSFGKVFFGAHDTPLKRAQGKIDLYNDQLGDIKSLFAGEVRVRDSFSWLSPQFANGLAVQAMYVPADNDFDASQSLAVTYDNGDYYASIAVDADMRKNERAVARTNVYDSIRSAVAYTPGDWKFGLLVQRSKQVNAVNASRESGYVVSVARKIGKWNLKGQLGQSDILQSDAQHALFSVDYQYNKQTDLYIIASSLDQPGGDTNVISAGVEYKF